MLSGASDLMENYPVEKLSIQMRERIMLPCLPSSSMRWLKFEPIRKIRNRAYRLRLMKSWPSVVHSVSSMPAEIRPDHDLPANRLTIIARIKVLNKKPIRACKSQATNHTRTNLHIRHLKGHTYTKRKISEIQIVRPFLLGKFKSPAFTM